MVLSNILVATMYLEEMADAIKMPCYGVCATDGIKMHCLHEMEWHIVKYAEYVPSAVQKGLDQSSVIWLVDSCGPGNNMLKRLSMTRGTFEGFCPTKKH